MPLDANQSLPVLFTPTCWLLLITEWIWTGCYVIYKFLYSERRHKRQLGLPSSTILLYPPTSWAPSTFMPLDANRSLPVLFNVTLPNNDTEEWNKTSSSTSISVTPTARPTSRLTTTITPWYESSGDYCLMFIHPSKLSKNARRFVHAEHNETSQPSNPAFSPPNILNIIFSAIKNDECQHSPVT